jgi:hypothetical protein
MEDLHRTHKEVSFGYWTQWVRPALAALGRNWRGRPEPPRRPAAGLDQLSAPH